MLCVGVPEDLVHRDQVGREPLDVIEHGAGRQRDVQHRPGQRRRGRQDRALERHDLLEPPARGVGEGQQPQRLAGRRAVDDDHVPSALAVVLLASAAVRTARRRRAARSAPPRRCGRVAALHQQLAEPGLDAGPVAAEFVLGVDLGRVEVAQRRVSARRRAQSAANPTGCEPGRSRGSGCAGRRRRSGRRSRRRPRSCRLRPCRCRGSCAASRRQRYCRSAAADRPVAARGGRCPCRSAWSWSCAVVVGVVVVVVVVGAWSWSSSWSVVVVVVRRRRGRLRERHSDGRRRAGRRPGRPVEAGTCPCRLERLVDQLRVVADRVGDRHRQVVGPRLQLRRRQRALPA